MGAGFTVLVGLCAIPSLDLALSARFYHPASTPPWYLETSPPWNGLYRYGEYPALIMAGGALSILLGSYLQPSWRTYRRHCLFLILAVALGPGLLVNGVLKPAWGRPRPRHIEPFGGVQPFRPWWQPGGPGAGESFPSGHAAMGYILLAGAFVVPRQRCPWASRCACVCALGFGTLLGVTRLVQGGHFASDVLWAGGLMYSLTSILHKVLKI